MINEGAVKFAEKKKKTQFAGTGCIVQGLGLIAPFVLWAMAGIMGVVIGILIFVILFFVGSAASSKWICDNCGNPLADKQVKICPTCRAEFS